MLEKQIDIGAKINSILNVENDRLQQFKVSRP